MRTNLRFLGIVVISLSCCCELMMENPSAPTRNQPIEQPIKQKTPRNIASFFPFEDNSNRWDYTESGGNKVKIAVSDTISDDSITYFRVSFREQRVDTTDDWFRQSSKGIFFSQSLSGDFSLFLPKTIDSVSGSFVSTKTTVSYHWYDSLYVNGYRFYNVVTLHYNCPIIHGFDGIMLADSIGIIQLTDDNGRWPITYAIDSCLVGGKASAF